MFVRPLSTVDNTRDYARVSHSRQWSNYNLYWSQWSGELQVKRYRPIP